MGILADSEAYLFLTIDKEVPLTLNSVRNYFKAIIYVCDRSKSPGDM